MIKIKYATIEYKLSGKNEKQLYLAGENTPLYLPAIEGEMDLNFGNLELTLFMADEKQQPKKDPCGGCKCPKKGGKDKSGGKDKGSGCGGKGKQGGKKDCDKKN